MRIKRTAISAVMLFTTLSVMPSAANATDNDSECTDTDFSVGNCLPASLEDGSTARPVVSAVQEALRSGQIAQATHFVNRRALVTNDQDQTIIEGLVRDALAALVGGVFTPGETETDYNNNSVTAARDGTGSVTNDLVGKAYKYGYCTASSCTYPTRVQYSFRYDILHFPEVVLAGEAYVTEGSRVTVNPIRCRTRENVNNGGDNTKYTWQNCADAAKSYSATQWLILEKNWNHVVNTSKSYHNDYSVSTNAYGKTYNYTWESRDYKKFSAGGWQFY